MSDWNIHAEISRLKQALADMKTPQDRARVAQSILRKESYLHDLERRHRKRRHGSGLLRG